MMSLTVLTLHRHTHVTDMMSVHRPEWAQVFNKRKIRNTDVYLLDNLIITWIHAQNDISCCLQIPVFITNTSKWTAKFLSKYYCKPIIMNNKKLSYCKDSLWLLRNNKRIGDSNRQNGDSSHTLEVCHMILWYDPWHTTLHWDTLTLHWDTTWYYDTTHDTWHYTGIPCFNALVQSNIATNYILSKARVFGLHFCHRHCGCSFSQFDTVGAQEICHRTIQKFKVIFANIC